MQNNIDLIKAIELWLSGKSISDYYLYGIKVLWIGRFGKIIAFMSALTIIIEIIGVNKTIEFVKAIQGFISTRYLKNIPQYLEEKYNRLISWLRNDFFVLTGIWVSIWGVEDAIYGSFSGLVSGYSLRHALNWLPYNLFAHQMMVFPVVVVCGLLFFVFLFLASPVIFALILLSISLPILLINITVGFTAFSLSTDRRINIVALFLLVLGSLLDFLAS